MMSAIVVFGIAALEQYINQVGVLGNVFQTRGKAVAYAVEIRPDADVFGAACQLYFTWSM
jgi:hypothetical protein